MKIKPDREIVTNLITGDQIRIERLKYHCRRFKTLKIIFSEYPLFEKEFDAFVLPAELIFSLQDIFQISKSGTPVLGYGNAKFLRRAFLTGCADYLKEPWGFEELECRLLSVANKKAESFSFSWGKLDLDNRRIACPEGKSILSYQEYKIVQTLIHNRGQVVPREVLYYAIWRKPAGSSSRVVDVHISSLRKKLLRLFPASKGCISTVRGIGYLIN